MLGRAGLLAIAAAIAAPASAQSAQQAVDRAKALFAADPCAPAPVQPGDTTDLVVCSTRAKADRFRLPLPVERASGVATGAVAGEPRSAAAALVPFAECGPFAGQRICAKAEARLYGYGGGRDPLTVGGNLLTRLIDPDAEIGDAPPAAPRP